MMNFSCELLTSNADNLRLIQNFCIDREKGCMDLDGVVGLEPYLKKCAWEDDINHRVKIYLIKDIECDNEIVSYFGLKAGVITDSSEGLISKDKKQEEYNKNGLKLLPSFFPAIEITHFAVNDNYRRKASHNGNPPKRLGTYIYPNFIYPIIENVANQIGVSVAYLYAAGDETLVSYYEKVFGFDVFDEYDDSIIPIITSYEKGCTFMYKFLNPIV